jgi:hypothetical protein
MVFILATYLENKFDVPNPAPYALPAVLWKQDQLG